MADTDLSESRSHSRIEQVRRRTPARILLGDPGGAYCTATQLALRSDHAAALDAVRAELHMERDLGARLIEQWRLFEISTEARSKSDYLINPVAGRWLSEEGRTTLSAEGSHGADVQAVIGDGLSVPAVASQVPRLLPLLASEVSRRKWTFGRPFVVRHCRVGILNSIGEILSPRVLVLLIGERPGLATAESLSAYMAYQPRQGHTDAERNLISNIHERGVLLDDAARRIANLANQMMLAKTSGIAIKEELAGETTRPVLVGRA